MALILLCLLVCFNVPVSPLECPLGDALGMENGDIESDQIRASTDKGNVEKARLNKQPKSSNYWNAGSGESLGWIGVDLRQTKIVTQIATQVEAVNGKYSIRFEVDYSNDDKTWETVSQHGKNHIFNGSSDDAMTFYHQFPVPVKLTYIRIQPLPRNDGSAINLRFELFGCDVPSTTPSPMETTSMITTPLDPNVISSETTALSTSSQLMSTNNDEPTSNQNVMIQTTQASDVTPVKYSRTGILLGIVAVFLVFLVLLLCGMVILQRRHRKDNNELIRDRVYYETVAENTPQNTPAKTDGVTYEIVNKSENTANSKNGDGSTRNTTLNLNDTPNGYNEITGQKSDESEYAYAYADFFGDSESDKKDKESDASVNIELKKGEEIDEASLSVGVPDARDNDKMQSPGNSILNEENPQEVEGHQHKTAEFPKEMDVKTEGWEDNTVYVASTGKDLKEEGWRENCLYETTETSTAIEPL